VRSFLWDICKSKGKKENLTRYDLLNSLFEKGAEKVQKDFSMERLLI
jgi:hypothetical protein